MTSPRLLQASKSTRTESEVRKSRRSATKDLSTAVALLREAIELMPLGTAKRGEWFIRASAALKELAP
jgi:hypothetical protein